MADKLRIGVVGVGHLGRHHTRIFKSLDGVELVGVQDIDQEKGQRVAALYGVRAFSDLDSMLEFSQAIAIVTPTTTHFQIAKQALERGVDVFIEKPICETLMQANEIIQLAERNRGLVQIGHIERFNPCLAALTGMEVNPLFIEVHRLSEFSPRGLDVAVILDLMIHDLDLILHLVKSPVRSVVASCSAVISESDDIANARITFANGCVANLTASRISPRGMRKLRIFQKYAYLSLDLSAKKVEIYELVDGARGDGSVVYQFPFTTPKRSIVFRQPMVPQYDMLTKELESFVTAVKQRTPPAVSAQEGYRALELALTILAIGRKQYEQVTTTITV